MSKQTPIGEIQTQEISPRDNVSNCIKREYGFSLTCILAYKDKIVDFVLIRENTCQ